MKTDYFKIVQFLFLKGVFYINTYLVNIYKGLLIVIKNYLKNEKTIQKVGNDSFLHI